MNRILVIGAILVLFSAGPVWGIKQEDLVARERRRLEELFIWKMSEELKLSVELEGPFGRTLRQLNLEKTKATLEVTAALADLERAQNEAAAKSKVSTEKAVKRYEKAWRAYGALPIQEVARLRKLLGTERLGRYLLAKAQMTEKLKALSARETDEALSPSESPPPPNR